MGNWNFEAIFCLSFSFHKEVAICVQWDPGNEYKGGSGAHIPGWTPRM